MPGIQPKRPRRARSFPCCLPVDRVPLASTALLMLLLVAAVQGSKAYASRHPANGTPDRGGL
jgi:hypothetical protein